MEREKDLGWSFQREVRYNQLNTDNLVFLKTMMEINFLKFILYRKMFRIQRAWETCYMGVENEPFNPSVVSGWERELPGIIIELTKWVEMLKTVPNIKPRPDFFEDIYGIKDDADWEDSDTTGAYDNLLKVAEEYKLVLAGVHNEST